MIPSYLSIMTPLIKERSLVQKIRTPFDILFSRVKTDATTDVKVHAAKMENFLSQFKFNENARMLSVVVHDDLDGHSSLLAMSGYLYQVRTAISLLKS